jgi:ribosomal protein L18E
MIIKIKGEDKTDKVSNYSFDTNKQKINIWFYGSRDPYSYDWSNVVIGPIKERKINNDQIVVYKDNYIENIEKFEYIGDGENASVKILANGQIMYYKVKNIKIQKCKKYNIKKDDIILIDGKIMTIENIEFTDDFARVRFSGSDKSYVYKKEKIIIEKRNLKFEKILQYYTEVAKVKDLNINDKVEKYLERQINNITIQKDSALYAFLSQKISKRLSSQKQTIYPFGINLSQRNAIKNAETNQLSLIQGPPGTGKTRSILNILANLIIQGKTAAVVSSNNDAIKNVQEKMEEEGYGFLIALLGKAENKELFFKEQPNYPEDLLEWKINSEEKKRLLFDIQVHENKVISSLEDKNNLAIIEQQLLEYKHEYDFFIEYLQKQEISKLKKLHFFKLDNTKLLKLLMELNYQQDHALSLVKKITYLFKYGIYDFQQFDTLDSIIIDLQDTYYKQKIVELEKDKEEVKQRLKLNNFDTEMQSLISKSRDYFRAYIADIYINQYSKRIEFSSSSYFYSNNFNKFVKEYPVILSTTHAISKSKNRDYMFDYLIVDEASQVELVPGIIALSTAKNAVIVGDLKQLPHIPEEKIKQEQLDEWHERFGITDPYNYYKHNLLSSFNAIFGDKIANQLLREHYRCHNRIISFCNKKYYDNLLVCHSKINNENPLVLLKTVPGNHMRYSERAVNKIINIRELESLVDQKFLNTAGINFECDKTTFGFIAPFRGQANVAHEILPSEFQKDTVHKFQGRECDIVMFSSVLDKKNISKQRLQFVDEPSLINVAISRAKEKFILVSDVDVFKMANGEINDLIRYMEYYEEESILCNSDVRSIFDLLYSDYEEVLKYKRKNRYWKKSKYDSENLMHELMEKILSEEKNKKYKYKSETKLKELFRNTDNLNEEEKKYIQNNARVDFIIYNRFDNQIIVAIEVDGFHYHENNPKQIFKDKLKDRIFEKYGIPLLRLKTNYSNEGEKIQSYL